MGTTCNNPIYFLVKSKGRERKGTGEGRQKRGLKIPKGGEVGKDITTCSSS
jgi:hypothetical protein